MSNSLEERLKSHSSAFDGLLSLIPAKYYYDEATQDQWQQKKKLKKELQQNKRAKLNPDSKDDADDYVNSHASAKDVMNNKAKNAKEVTIPSMKKFPQAIIEKAGSEEDDNEKEEDEKDEKDEKDEEQKFDEKDEEQKFDEKDEEQKFDEKDEEQKFDDSLIKEQSLVFDDEGNEITSHKKDGDFAKQKKNKKELSPEEKQAKNEKLLKLREKLSSKINTLREKRKAPGTKNGGAVKSRDQILEERKRKEEIRKQEKLKRKHEEVEADSESESEDEDEVNNEGNKKPENEDSVLFGNIVFQDGSRVTSDLNRLRDSADKKKMKGPANRDLKAHLTKLEQKKRKFAQLSPEEQLKQKEKDQWQRVMSQAEGVKLKDDEKLLRKAIKRKEKQKLRSEIEWKDRKQVVKDTVAARAKRREENLKSRKDNKGKRGKKNQTPKLRKFSGTINKKAAKNTKNNKKRAGFEGSAKSKGKGSK
ncbi:SURF6-domain-containing protein [Hyphopichia burtonii NRRL Y-1933]|uniref:SURF6-domain-containing protein n=1 Tax=Hyphopichia burtonii NRRL Y-1933 TaxID=984485 RepID=A0A1E4RPL3_9ASCO|nr:SURF6-domain-containing protein [Hyphopichia burtonii NRRL Y-1933]ODV69207.1 SURF6-domain-containing protein [Hyphopichia burtonii NRRL Y-1933]